MYTNLKADKILETLRQTVDQDKQQSLYSDLIKEIQNDRPAIFIYSPYFLYVAPNKIHNISLGVLSSPNERFGNVNEWYIETSSVWKIFQN
jgi:peptide/nickel transport system substrate-binding protein